MSGPPVASREPASVPGLPLSTAVVYALPNAGTGFAFFMVSIFFLKYATDVLVISAAAMGWILFAARLWDAVSDPLMGFLTDRTRTRLGRRPPWMIGSALPLGLLIVALWSPPASLTGGALTAWTCVVFLLLYSATTAFAVPYDALGAELTSDYRERTRLFGLRRISFGIGALAALGGVALLSRDDLATEAGRLAARATAWQVALLAALVMAGLGLFAACRLRERSDYLTRGARDPMRAFRDVWRNQRARRLLLVFAVQQLGVTCIILTAPFFIDYVLEAPSHVASVILAFMVSGTLSIPLWMAAGRRYEKKTLVIVAMVVISLAMLPGLFVGPGDLLIALPAVAVAGFAAGGTDTLFPALQADVIDFDEHDSGERKEGTYFAAWAFASKTASGGAGVLVGFALNAAGYVPNAPQSVTATAMIRFLYAAAPLVLWSASILVFRGFELTGAQHREIRAIIDARARERTSARETPAARSAGPVRFGSVAGTHTQIKPHPQNRAFGGSRARASPRCLS
jgi:sugar (glycoside-pentoside-hexuronide) transporter